LHRRKHRGPRPNPLDFWNVLLRAARAELALRARRAEEPQRRSVTLLRVIGPVAAPPRRVQPARRSTLNASQLVDLRLARAPPLSPHRHLIKVSSRVVIGAPTNFRGSSGQRVGCTERLFFGTDRGLRPRSTISGCATDRVRRPPRAARSRSVVHVPATPSAHRRCDRGVERPTESRRRPGRDGVLEGGCALRAAAEAAREAPR
jgi:hypothetical protein